MALRPQAFSIPSTTQLKVTFTDELAFNISARNFEVESLNGSVNDLDVTGIELDGSVVIIKTRPMVSGNYYLLKFIDVPGIPFASSTGQRLVNDAISRELFFVGIENINPVRDRIFQRVPDIISLENSVVKDVLSAQAEEIFTAQKKVGQLLSDNYICVDVVDEFRVRGPGATDRFANEQAFKVSRVSKEPTGSLPIFKKIEYTSNNIYNNLQTLPTFPISLQEEIVEDEVISLSSNGNLFEGFLVSVASTNITKLLSLRLIKSNDVEDCDGNIGTEYDIERFKYTLSDNRYDQAFAFEFSQLEPNQVLLSQFGNISRPEPGDTIVVSYLKRNTGQAVLPDTVTVSRVETQINEPIPTNTVRFFLDNAPIVTANNTIPSRGGVKFRSNENDNTTPFEFSKELSFNIAKLPSNPGEYSVNYETGEVFLVGDETRLGTSRNTYVASYNYRREFLQDLDYSISGSDLVANPNRMLSGSEAEITLNYENVFVPDVDYKFASHLEVMGEQVENRLTQAFGIETLNSPITNVYRILNQTTGEVYNPLFHTDTEILFSGNRSPEIRTSENEIARFTKVINENLNVIGEFIVPVFEVEITSNVSNNAIGIFPAIPAEFISTNSTDYFIREASIGEEVTVDDTQIRFFGNPDGNNLISSLAISPTASPPSSGSRVIIGTRGYIIALEEPGVLNKNLDGLGFHGNTSLRFSDSSIFSNEKFFNPIESTSGFVPTSAGRLSVSLNFGNEEILYTNLSRIRKVGDYSVDYRRGVIYLAVGASADYNIGMADYEIFKHNSVNNNILTTLSVTKKRNRADDLQDALFVYQTVPNTSNDISVLDLEYGFDEFDNATDAPDGNGDLQLICNVLENYTTVVPQPIQNITGIYNYTDIVGQNLNASSESDRKLEINASLLTTPVSQGGFNLNDGAVSFEKNVIDLKKKARNRVVLEIDGTYSVTIRDEAASAFFDCRRANGNGTIYFDSKLNITKVDDLQVVNSTLGVGTAVVDVITNAIAAIDTDDFLLDLNGNRFAITSVDTLLSQITVQSPAENNVTALEPVLDPIGTGSEIVIKPTVTVGGGELVLSIPSDALLTPGELIDVTYLTTNTPPIGTPLLIDYRFGDIYFDYNYVFDQIAIWYEYGDNQIDWSISNTLQEGDEYFVNYSYGANRTALRANFGTLTQVPFFQQFPLDIDRELYRNGVKGTLQAFPKGPTKPAFEGLIESFTDIKPEITELSFGSWILGRDYTCPTTVETNGNLTFTDGRFGSGLQFDEQTEVSIPRISNISLREGTLQAWIRPDWGGISNDASLTFCFEGIGKERFKLLSNMNPFTVENGWEMAPASNIGGLVDTKGLGTRIINFTTEGTENYQANNNGIYKSFKFLNRITPLQLTTQLKVNDYGIHFNRISSGLLLQENHSVAKIAVTDQLVITGLSLDLTAAEDDSGLISFSVSDSDINRDEIFDFNRPHKTRNCLCSITNRISELKKFNSLTMDIELSTPISTTFLKGNTTVIDNSPGVFIISDMNGDFYQVVAFESPTLGVVEDFIPDTISNIIVDRFPINNRQITQASVADMNNLIPTGTLVLYYKNAKIIGSGSANNEQAFKHQSEFIINWSEYRNYGINRKPLDNLIDFEISNQIYSSFYTDALDISSNEVNSTLSNEDNKGIYIGPLNNQILSNVDLYSVVGTFHNRFDVDDIYIGRDSYNPRNIPFTINRDDSPKVSVGLPNNVDVNEGIFIGYDEVCTSPLSPNTGQWVVRTRAARYLDVPSSITPVESEDGTIFRINTERVSIEHCFSGYVLTDGEFSSVERSTRDEIDGLCTTGIVCDQTFRYCANELLEDYGWIKIEESESDLINTIVGGRETISGLWRKEGSFTSSSSSGIYRAGPSLFEDQSLENVLLTELPCSGGNIEYLVSLRVSDFDTNIIGSDIGSFSGTVNGNLTGIVPIHIQDEIFDLKVALAVDNFGDGLVAIIDNTNKAFVDLVRYNWNDDGFHEFQVLIDYDSQEINIYIDNFLISRTLFNEYLDTVSGFNQDTIGLHVFDNSLVDSEEFHNTLDGNIVDIDLIFFSGFYQEGDGYLESSDVFIHTDDRIDFEFKIDELDGYIDIDDSEDDLCAFIVGISTMGDIIGGPYPCGDDGYDGYLGDAIVGVDEMFISSDKVRYIVDTGAGEADQRLSLFKDGKGFLNFRIFDNSLSKKGEVGIYNIATNIKDFAPGEQHHVAISWKLNSIDERDEMHLFLDGLEVPNLYRFGGRVPVRLNEKFSDVSKEVLQNFLVRDITYPEILSDGIVSASLSLFQSSSYTFDLEDVGRSIIVYDAPLANTLIGQEFIIIGVTTGSALLGRGDNLELIEFDTSDSNISWAFAPYSNNVLTDIRNSRFFIYKTDNSENEIEMGGILYQITNGQVDVISGDNVTEPTYRANVDTGLIEFVGRNSNCEYFPTVNETDIDIHIKTFGLNLELCRNKVSLGSSSYEGGEVKFSGLSVLNLHAKEPLNLRDVKIRRIILDRTAVDIVNPQIGVDGLFTADFEIDLTNNNHKVSSEAGNVYRQNLGRKLSVVVDSDNIDFCEFDGYDDGYQDGYLDGQENTITIYGATTDGVNEETFFVDKNGSINGTKFFTSVERVEGTLKVIDPDYFELGVISIEEVDTLDISNNGGNALEVWDYRSGHFVLTTVGSNGTFPFELHAGAYLIEYPSYLSIKMPEAGKKIYIGRDIFGENYFGGSIDEFRIISEISSDTRPTEIQTTGTRSVTDDFFRANEFCPDDQTLALIHFNDPIDLQLRRLRNAEFLDEDTNFKFSLNRTQLENLLLSINNERDFVMKMINYGFSLDDANKTYIEAHFAEGGPVWNDADYYRNYVEFVAASKSVNNNFGTSAFFTPGYPLLFENDEGLLRKNEGTIEFWVSPLLDTSVDDEIRYFIDASPARRIRAVSKSPTVIELENPVSEILSIKLLTRTVKDSNLYNSEDADRILFDELVRSEISGVLEGGTGTDKDFSVGHRLSADGKKIFLADSLPGVNVDVAISYIPQGAQGDRLSIYKNEFSQIVFGITAGGIDNVVAADVNWKKNTWHRVKVSYKTNSPGNDFLRISVDGEEGGIIRYGTGLIYGTNYVYGQYAQGQGAKDAIDYRIPLADDLRIISVGSDVFGSKSALSRMDNIRFSRIIRTDARDALGNLIDSNYSENLNTVQPVVEDDATTFILDFNANGERIDNFIRVVDPQNGIFNFSIDVFDNFDKVIGINNGQIEDLIVELVNRLKPAHTNAYVKFKKTTC